MFKPYLDCIDGRLRLSKHDEKIYPWYQIHVPYDDARQLLTFLGSTKLAGMPIRNDYINPDKHPYVFVMYRSGEFKVEGKDPLQNPILYVSRTSRGLLRTWDRICDLESNRGYSKKTFSLRLIRCLDSREADTHAWGQLFHAGSKHCPNRPGSAWNEVIWTGNGVLARPPVADETVD